MNGKRSRISGRSWGAEKKGRVKVWNGGKSGVFFDVVFDVVNTAWHWK